MAVAAVAAAQDVLDPRAAIAVIIIAIAYECNICDPHHAVKAF